MSKLIFSKHQGHIPIENIRNFSIIAHIDHGKSTLADRFIQLCDGLSDREMASQVLDSMSIERERGITIKAQCVTLYYTALDKKIYQLNLIDTPGHVDFVYEVSRSLAACEGALLVVDAAQGVEAQSVANCYAAVEQGLEVIPVLNKIDLPQADTAAVKYEIEEIIGIDANNACCISAKNGVGILEVLEAVVGKIPSPQGSVDGELQALIIDSWFDTYLGVVSLLRIKQGVLKKNDKILIKSTKESYVIDSLGIFTPKKVELEHLCAGEVGFVTASIKDIYGAPVGDTITHAATSHVANLAGFKKVKPQVYAGLFTVLSDDYHALKEALSKLSLNDSSLFFETESSSALGYGFRCGFLGMLHMEIIQERLEREYNLDLIATAPTVIYQVLLKDQSLIRVDNPADLPPMQDIQAIKEPIARVNILVPNEMLGAVIKLCIEKRGVQKDLQYVSKQASVVYEIPMNEVVLNFFDKLKSVSRGYASLDYHFVRFENSDVVKLDVLINGDKVDALSSIVHKAQSYKNGCAIIEKMKTLIPRQMFDVALQAAIGNQVIARQTVKALRKNVTAKCYGGDISRKRKLLEKQKAGKKRMKQVGSVSIPQEAFLAVLSGD